MAARAPDTSDGFSPARRTILAVGGAGVLAGIAGYFGWPKSDETPDSLRKTTPRAAGKPMDGTLIETSPIASQGFQPFLNSEFVIIPTAENLGQASCKLTKISPEFRQDTFKGSFVSFTLLFEAAPGFLPEGGICRVKHDELKEMEIFLSPVGRPGDKTFLEAVFSERV